VGYLTTTRDWGVAWEDGLYVLEDGTQLTERDMKPFTEWNATFTLPEAFGLQPCAPSKARVDVTGRLATYQADRTQLGRWADRVSDPIGSWGGTETVYRVLLDKDRARIYAYLGVLDVWAPVLWLDRHGHWVTFTWNRVLPPKVALVRYSPSRFWKSAMKRGRVCR